MVFFVNYMANHTVYIRSTVNHLCHVYRPHIILIRTKGKLHRRGEIHAGIRQVVGYLETGCRETVLIHTRLFINYQFCTFRCDSQTRNAQFGQVYRIVYIQRYGTGIPVNACLRGSFGCAAKLPFHFKVFDVRFFNGIRNIVLNLASVKCQQA